MTFFITSEVGIKLQERYVLNRKVERIFALSIPFIHTIEKGAGNKFETKTMVMHEFAGLDLKDITMRNSILNFSFHITTGNLDEAYKSVKSIQNPFVWEKMAEMCVKSRRLDVAEICIGNMRFARGAKAIRESKSEPELESQLAMVAIQLGMEEEAARLYESVKRYDLLNKMYIANG